MKKTKKESSTKDSLVFQEGPPNKKVWQFIDYHLKPIMLNGFSHIRDSDHFLDKMEISENVLSVTVDVMGLYPSNQGWFECSQWSS